MLILAPEDRQSGFRWAYRRRGQLFLTMGTDPMSWQQLYRVARKLRKSQETFFFRGDQLVPVLGG